MKSPKRASVFKEARCELAKGANTYDLEVAESCHSTRSIIVLLLGGLHEVLDRHEMPAPNTFLDIDRHRDTHAEEAR